MSWLPRKLRSYNSPSGIQRIRSDLTILPWIGASFYKACIKLAEEIEEIGQNASFMVGIWPDIEIARTYGISVQKVVRLRRILGASSMTVERFAEIERSVGPFCEVLIRHGQHIAAYQILRWRAGLTIIRTKHGQHPGLVSWRYQASLRHQLADAYGMPSTNCFSCRYWRGHFSGKDRDYKHDEAYCMAPKGLRRLIGRKWLHKHGGTVKRLPSKGASRCPAWEAAKAYLDRSAMRVTLQSDNRPIRSRSGKKTQFAPAPLPRFRAREVVESESWQILMDLIRDKLAST